MKSVCLSVCVSPHFFELNQTGHNSVNFEARTSRFFMVVDLEEEHEDMSMRTKSRRTTMTRRTTTTMTTFFVFFAFFAKPKKVSEAKQKKLSKAKQTPAEQLPLLSLAIGVQF